MARRALTSSEVTDLNYKVQGFGDRLADIERAGYLEFQTWIAPPIADVDAVLAAHTDTGAEVVITTGITNPGVPRNITATADGTAGDIKAITVTIEGTDYDGNVISETLPAFTVNTAGTVQGSKAFRTVTSITIPAHDGTGATTSIGFGDKLGLKKCLQGNTVILATLDGVYETTRPTVAFDYDDISGNTVDINGTLDGDKDVVVIWLDQRRSDVITATDD